MFFHICSSSFPQQVRYESGGLSRVFHTTGEKYDVRIGTSERGTDVQDVDLTVSPVTHGDDVPRLPRRILLVLGGLEGLEFACRNDPKLIKLAKKLKAKRKTLTSRSDEGKEEGMEVDEEHQGEEETVDPRDLFDHYVNVCPQQGSRTIRTEEALFISLAAIVPKINAVFQDWENWV
jgi:hypothetical protein